MSVREGHRDRGDDDASGDTNIHIEPDIGQSATDGGRDQARKGALRLVATALIPGARAGVVVKSVAADPTDTTKGCASCGVKTEKPPWVREHSVLWL